MVEFVRRRKRPCQQAAFFFFFVLLVLIQAPVFAQQPAAKNNDAAKPATKPEAKEDNNKPAAEILPVVPPPKWYMSLFSKMDMNHDGLLDPKEYESGRLSLEQAMADHATTTSRPAWFSARGFWKAFTSSITMIIATEIGDKTFFIAAVLSMKHSRSAVFGGAIVALIVMTVLSTAMGLVLPKLIPRRYTHVVGGLLFLYFGIKLVAESRSMEAGKTSEELQEVEEELSCRKKNDQEDGDVESSPASGPVQILPASAQWYSVAWQALSLTFLAEWGDRSQIATVALAASKNPVGVTIGGCLGHALCTGMAVIGGRMLASRISEKTVSQYGGLIFLLFGFHSLFLEE